MYMVRAFTDGLLITLNEPSVNASTDRSTPIDLPIHLERPYAAGGNRIMNNSPFMSNEFKKAVLASVIGGVVAGIILLIMQWLL